VPAHNTPIKASRREALLIAIAKARQWIDDLAHGRAASFAVIARREGKVERHIRLLAPLAFVSPRIVSALLDGTAPADLTLTKLIRALPYCWAEQEQRVGASTLSSPMLIGPNAIEMPFSKPTACLRRVAEPTVRRLYR
jgi:hypothetical protein